MLKPKKLPESSGAENLAGMMINFTQEMNVHTLSVDDLYDAPAEWNFFRPLPDAKFFELLESIEQNGLLVPLIVWERPDEAGGYMMLSGHNRARALRNLYARTGENRFRQAQCVVYRQASLDEEQAREIIVDCNWVQRVLSPGEKAQAIYYKYVQMGRQKRGSGKRGYAVVAEQFGLKPTQVYQYYKLAQIEPQWLERFDRGEITVKMAAYLADLSPEQRRLLLTYPDLTQRELFSIDRRWDLERTRRALEQERRPQKELRVLVPEDRYEEVLMAIREMLSKG